MDVDNGIWSIYGAREGAYRTMCTDWDYSQVRDFDWLTEQWNEVYSKIDVAMLPYEVTGLGLSLSRECGLEISDLDANGSKFFKTVYNNTPRARIRHV